MVSRVSDQDGFRLPVPLPKRPTFSVAQVSRCHGREGGPAKSAGGGGISATQGNGSCMCSEGRNHLD